MYKKITIEQTPDVVTITLRNTRGNILDGEMMSEIISAVQAASAQPSIKALVFQGDGDHFSFGASVPEHQRDQVAGMLKTFHTLFRSLIEFSRPTMAVVRGQCLGGGLELAAFCHWIFASEQAQFGQPEIQLAVFPPVASLLLPARIGQAAADDLNLTGRSIQAAEALRIGLIHHVSADPAGAARTFLDTHIRPKSAVALRYAVRAGRQVFHKHFLEEIDRLEAFYLGELMKTHDANEGITAFIEKRKPTWTHQ